MKAMARGAFWWTLAVVMLVAVAVALGAHPADAATVAQAGHGVAADGVRTLSLLGFAGMISYPWQRSTGGPVMSRAQLEKMANPQSAGENEVIPHILYDTQSIANGAGGPFTYFQALQADKTLGNVPGPGQLPDPYYMIVEYVAADLLIEPAAGDSAAFTPWSDASELLIAQRATFQVTINDKTYGPYPLVACHALGGVNAFGVLEGATAAPGAGVFNVNNGAPGSGGFFVGGAWTIGPKVGYSLQVNLAAAPTLSATTRLRMSLVGTLYRAVR